MGCKIKHWKLRLATFAIISRLDSHVRAEIIFFRPDCLSKYALELLNIHTFECLYECSLNERSNNYSNEYSNVCMNVCYYIHVSVFMYLQTYADECWCTYQRTQIYIYVKISLRIYGGLSIDRYGGVYICMRGRMDSYRYVCTTFNPSFYLRHS